MTPNEIKFFFEYLKSDNPNPKCELNYTTPFTLLVAIVLSAQATDKGVNKATEKLFEKVSSAQDMLDLGLDGLKEYTKTINYYPTKSKHIMELSRQIVENFGGCVPDNTDDLQKLSGVGRKSANVFLNVIYGRQTIAVDTHVFRVANRLKMAVGKTPIEVETKLHQVVPDEYKTNASHWMVLFGRYTCLAKKPKCENCFAQKMCPFYKNNS